MLTTEQYEEALAFAREVNKPDFDIIKFINSQKEKKG